MDQMSRREKTGKWRVGKKAKGMEPKKRNDWHFLGFWKRKPEKRAKKPKERKLRIQKLKKALHDRFTQIKWRFGLYIPVCIFLAFAGSLLIGNMTNDLQDWCTAQSESSEGEITYDMWYDIDGTMHYEPIWWSKPNEGAQEIIYNLISFSQVLLIPVWILFSVYLTGKIFYNRELKVPMNLLLNAASQIADNHLDFQLEYDKPNEFGMLCRAFEDMRLALYDSNRELWRSLEERKRLNAAFSHDLRTPLTVLRGYVDFLEKYIPGGNVSEEKLMNVLGMMSGQIVRLEHYTQTMNSVQKLSDIVPNIGLVPAGQVRDSFRQTGELLCGKKQFALDWQVEGERELYLDMELVFQIYENLVSNACRYAKETVFAGCALERGMFLFVVEDDGRGFSAEALRCASEPFFRDEKEPDKTHFGLGLYICRILCEKCGGMLKIGNITDENGKIHGGRVMAMVAYQNSPTPKNPDHK